MSLFENKRRLQEYIQDHYSSGCCPESLGVLIASTISSIYMKEKPSPIDCHNTTIAIAKAIKKMYMANPKEELKLYAFSIHAAMIREEGKHFNRFMSRTYADTEKVVFSKFKIAESLN